MSKEDPNKNRKVVVLTLTESCNLDCVYCFEKAKTKGTMTIQIAKNIIHYEFNNSDQYDEIEFDLFGGEPTLCKSLIQELVEWTDIQKFDKPYLFFLETNGTLVHGEFQDWLIKHKDHVNVSPSLDGTPNTHNRNRSNSYNLIDIGFFLLHYPEQSVRMTINSTTIGNLFQDVVHLHSLGFSDIVSTFAHGIVWELDNIDGNLSEELKKLCDYYLDHPEIVECSIFDMQLSNIFRKEKTIEKWCGTGSSMISYGVDGTRYPCHTFQSNTTNTSKAIELSEIDFNNIADYSDSDCCNCILEVVCPNCYGMNYVTNGDILKRDKGSCSIVKTRALAVLYLRAMQFENNPEMRKPNETYQTIAAIKAIQSQLSAM